MCQELNADQSLVDGETSTKVTLNVYFEENTTVSTRTLRDKQSRDAVKDGKRRQLTELDAKRSFLHADALTETYVKPPHLRDTERAAEEMYGTLPAVAGWQHLVQKVGADIGLLCSSNCPCVFGHSSRDLDMVVHGDDFIVAGCGDDHDWLSQKLNEKLELVQKARLGPGYDSEGTVLNRCVIFQRLWTDVGS